MEKLPFLVILAHSIFQLLKNHDSLIVLGHTPANVHLDALGPLLDLSAVFAANAAFLKIANSITLTACAKVHSPLIFSLFFELLRYFFQSVLVLSFDFGVAVVENEAITADVHVDEHIGDIFVEPVIAEGGEELGCHKLLGEFFVVGPVEPV